MIYFYTLFTKFMLNVVNYLQVCTRVSDTHRKTGGGGSAGISYLLYCMTR